MQEALLRLEQSDRASIQNVEAWLTTVVTRLSSTNFVPHNIGGKCILANGFRNLSSVLLLRNRTRSRDHAYLWASCTFSKNWNPEQRAVFVLREVFEHSYQSIAEIAGKSEAACRQLMVRARAALDRARQSPPVLESPSPQL